ncbi:NUDIX domain-containing protein [Alicyclobacillus curvatus]|nr:NUDIX domain-containing protein [Alicyclobacillus curvatus]
MARGDIYSRINAGDDDRLPVSQRQCSPHEAVITETFHTGRIWSGIGGHVESNEHGDLRSACLREIKEETGLQSEDVKELALRYVILRQRKQELRQQFIYFGTTTKTELGTTDEGTLHWMPTSQVFNCKMTDSNRLMLMHYFDNEPSSRVWVGTTYGEAGQARMNWASMSDWEP